MSEEKKGSLKTTGMTTKLILMSLNNRSDIKVTYKMTSISWVEVHGEDGSIQARGGKAEVVQS